MAKAVTDGYLYDDCHICGLGDRGEGIRWVDFERDYHQITGMRHRLLVCSSCLGEGLAALATLVKDEDGADANGTDDGVQGTADGAPRVAAGASEASS